MIVKIFYRYTVWYKSDQTKSVAMIVLKRFFVRFVSE